MTYPYDAWGNILSTGVIMAGTLGVLNPLRYRGYVYDTETGLYYLQSRYYDPEICRFINADGYASTGQGLLGGNAFAYCLNCPASIIDSIGKIPMRTYSVRMTDSGRGPERCHSASILSREQYSRNNWNNANKNEKKQILESLVVDISDLLGIYVNPKIKYYSKPYGVNDSKSRGYYDVTDNSIYLNEYMLDDPNNSYDLLKTVCHEIRHAYQYAATYGFYFYGYQSPFSVSRSILCEWDYNIDHYIRSDENFDEYYDQPIEVDARMFANQTG